MEITEPARIEARKEKQLPRHILLNTDSFELNLAMFRIETDEPSVTKLEMLNPWIPVSRTFPTMDVPLVRREI